MEIQALLTSSVSNPLAKVRPKPPPSRPPKDAAAYLSSEQFQQPDAPVTEVKKIVEPEPAQERTATIANSNSIPKSDADHLYTYAKNQQQALKTDLPSYRLNPNQYDSLLRSHQSQQMTQDQYIPEMTTPVAQTQNMESQKQSMKKSGEKTVPNRSIEEALDKPSFRQSKSKIGKSTEKIGSGEQVHQRNE